MSDVSWTTRIREPEDSIMWAEDIMKGISEMDFLTVKGFFTIQMAWCCVRVIGKEERPEDLEDHYCLAGKNVRKQQVK